MRGIKEFLIPGSLDYTLKLLDMHQGDAIVLAGGTHLALVKNSSSKIIIDIKNSGLNFIKEDNDNVKIGATTRAVDIIKSDLIKSYGEGILVTAASKIGSPLTRNLVTVGGNIYSNFPWSNLPPALLVLDASVELSSLEGRNVVKLQELLAENPRKFVDSNEIITAILIPESSKYLKTSYKVFALTENDYDMVIVAVGLHLESTFCKIARIAVGAATVPATLVPEASTLLENKELTLELIEEAANKVISNINVVNDFRTTREHSLEVVRTLVKRALEDCRL